MLTRGPSLGVETYSRMVDMKQRRTLGMFGLRAISFLIVIATIGGTAANHRGGLASAMLGSLEESTRNRDIEEFTRNYLQNDPTPDSSFRHVIIHPKVNNRTVQAVLKAFSEIKSTVIRIDDKRVVYSGCNSIATCSKIRRVVGIYEKVDDIDPRGWKKMYGISWNSRAKIAIWLGNGVNRNNSLNKIEFEKTLASFWSVKAVNVVLLAMPWCGNKNNCSDIAKPRVFGYDPFVPVGVNKRGKLFERSPGDPLFPDKLNNLHGMPIRISIYQQQPRATLINNNTELGSGIDVSSLRYMSKWMNFTVKLVTAPTNFTSYTTHLSCGQIIGPIGDILNNRSDILGNTVYLQKAWDMDVDFLRPFARAYTNVVVPHAERMPGLLRMFRTFDNLLTGLIFLISLVLICYFVVIKNRYPLFSVFRLLMHQQIRNMRTRTSHRIFLIFWLIWAYIVSIATQTQLLKDLASPPFYPNINTLEKLVESEFPLMGDKIDLRSLENSHSRIKNRLAENFILEQNVSRCMEILKDHKNVSCAIDAAYVERIVKNVNKEFNQETLTKRNGPRSRSNVAHIAKEILDVYIRTVIVEKNFPYLYKFNKGYYQTIEYGLVSKWLKENDSPEFEENRPPTKLGLNHFEGTFKIFLIGHGLAFIVFLVEIVFHRAKRIKRNDGSIRPERITLPNVDYRSRENRSRYMRRVRRSIPLQFMERL